MKNNWVVIANSEEAKIYILSTQNSKDNGKLVTNFEYADGKLKHSNDQNANVEGNSGNAVTRHDAPKDVNDAKFANILANYLNKHHDNFDKLSIIAEAHFLGLLLKDLNNNVAQQINKKISKDYIHSLKVHEITLDKIFDKLNEE